MNDGPVLAADPRTLPTRPETIAEPPPQAHCSRLRRRGSSTRCRGGVGAGLRRRAGREAGSAHAPRRRAECRGLWALLRAERWRNRLPSPCCLCVWVRGRRLTHVLTSPRGLDRAWALWIIAAGLGTMRGGGQGLGGLGCSRSVSQPPRSPSAPFTGPACPVNLGPLAPAIYPGLLAFAATAPTSQGSFFAPTRIPLVPSSGPR